MNSNSLSFHRSRKAYIRIIFSIVFLIGMFMLCGYLFYDVYRNHAPVSDQFLKKWIVMLVFASILLFIFTGFMLKSWLAFIKATSPVTITYDNIKIGDDIFTFSEIEQINTIDLGNFSHEYFYGASIILLNREKKFIMGEQLYVNESILFNELESINQHYFSTDKSKISHEKQNTIDATTILLTLDKNDSEGKANNVQSLNTEIHEPKYFDFNIFTSINYLLYLGIVIISLSGIYKHIESPRIALFFLGLLVFMYYGVARESFHYIINSHTLQIKNKLLFGYSKTYILKDIQGIVIYWKNSGRTNQYRMIVTLNDYTSTSFSSDEFRKKQWIKLGKALRNSGVTVVNYWETLD